MNLVHTQGLEKRLCLTVETIGFGTLDTLATSGYGGARAGTGKYSVDLVRIVSTNFRWKHQTEKTNALWEDGLAASVSSRIHQAHRVPTHSIPVRGHFLPV